MESPSSLLQLDPDSQLVTVVNATPTVSIIWDRAAQAAVIETAVGPTIASRAYAITHTAIFDAWASYDEDATGAVVGDDLQVGVEQNTEAHKATAMSWAAYTVLLDLFPAQSEIFDAALLEAGEDPTATPADGSAAALGVAVAEAVIAERAGDGANQSAGYADTTGYAPTNIGPGDVIDIAAWTPEFVPIDPDEPELRPDESAQNFLTPHWGTVTPFALSSGDALRPEAPEPFFTGAFADATLNIDAGTITLGSAGTVDGAALEAGSVIPVTPDLIGDVINPGFITQTEEVIAFSANLTEEQKLIAEFWEDGGGTSFPPGTWMTFGQFVSTRDGNTVDEDAALFFQLANAVMDAGIATWEAKTFYDYVRPVRAVRELGALGLIGEEGPEGNTIEAYAGEGLNTQTILAKDFITYQTPGADVSPPFAEYTSGHSAFSAAGAEVLLQVTGSDDFGGAITFPAQSSRFEPSTTPAEDLTLSWDTFSIAADEAGISRLYGGIHFEDGDINGRSLGREVGAAVIDKAADLIDGSAAEVTRQRIAGDGDSETQTAGRGDDVMIGRGGEDVQSGLAGNDRMRGGLGDDRLYGGDDDDLLFGGGGADTLVGGAGDDVARGGRGGDRFVYDSGADLILDFRLTFRRFDGDILELVGLGEVLEDADDFYTVIALLEGDGDAQTGASVSGRDLVLEFSDMDSVTLRGLISRNGLDQTVVDDLLGDAVG
ncbi:MAG: DUF6851 domain-containing protein [Pseudomonadota bacterium]